MESHSDILSRKENQAGIYPRLIISLSSKPRRTLTFKVSSVSGLIPGGQCPENNSSIVRVGSTGSGLGTGNTSYIMLVKGILRLTDRRREERYYLGCGSHSASSRSAV